MKKKYFIRVEHHKTGKTKSGNISCYDIGSVIKTLGRYGWIVTKQYEKD